ncbi:MAG: choice-of-anchor Q domain-containing protein [bacterium]|nr:choice-of-anchor Q domain-containing protein [bacterium]
MKARIATLVPCVLFAFWGGAMGATRYVDDSVSTSGDGTSWQTAFKTIQQGIDSASHSDTVLVAEGTYIENIHFNGKNIILTSTDPLAPSVVANTVIDGNQSGSVVTFSGTEDEACVLSGFTVRNGRATYLVRGGGICGGTDDVRTRAAIQDNVISRNDAWYGGGLGYCRGMIEHNTISGNTAFYGAGLALCDGTIRGNTVASNSAQRDGGGLYGCDGAIECNTITGNSVAQTYNGGGGLAFCSGVIENNLVAGNTAYKGGGLYACTGTIQNNTICGNSASKYIGGVYVCYATIRNCIIWGNQGWGGHLSQIGSSNTPSFSCIQGWTEGGEGNIAEDPQFASDYRLQGQSPCMDSGVNFYWFAWPERDLDGNCRLAGVRVDMGCFEYGALPDTDGDLLSDPDEVGLDTDPNRDDTDADGLRDGIEALRGSDPLAATGPRIVKVPVEIPMIQQALCLAGDEDEVIVSPGTYQENIHFCGIDVTLRSMDPQDPDILASTILDGGGRGPVVSFTAQEKQACVLSGFTIRNGRALWGAGIQGGTPEAHTHASIRTNVIMVNNALGDEYYSGYGAGMAHCDGTIYGDTISGNIAKGRGGGLAYCHGMIESNIITGNSSTGDGGGIAACDGTIHNNVISDNSAGDSGGGLYGCDGEVHGNTVVSNTAKSWGGGGLSDCRATIRNNIIAANSSVRYGGGLYRCKVIINNTIYGNSAREKGGGLYGCEGSVHNCIIWGNSAAGGDEQVSSVQTLAYCCIQNWNLGGTGNVRFDPRFAGAENGGFHLDQWSPCIDAGDPASPFENEPEPNGGRINMGAYGNTPEATPTPPDTDKDGLPDSWELASFGNLGQDANDDPDGDGVVNIDEWHRASDPTDPDVLWYVDSSVEVSGDGKSWAMAFKTIQEAIESAHHGDRVTVAEGLYAGAQFKGKSITLTSVDPLDPTVVEKTIVAGVSFGGAEDESCSVSGFTIHGWVRGKATHAIIQNNTIEDGDGVDDCDGVIRNNTIRGNYAYTDGGGLRWCDGIIQANVIIGNATVGVYGGGLYDCNGTIENNLVAWNVAACESGQPYSLGGYGGGLCGCGGTIRNNTIVLNHAQHGQNGMPGDPVDGVGGGLYYCTGIIENCVIWGNTARIDPQLSESSKPAYSHVGGDPHFVDSDNRDFRLKPTSPCIDAGFNDPKLPGTDFAGMPRIMYGGKSFSVDMGAYEFFYTGLQKGPGQDEATLVWSFVPNKTYSIFYTDDLFNWLPAIENFPSSGSQTTSWTDDGSLTGLPPLLAPQRFYRTLENP